MQIFLDTASLKEIRELADMIDGVTTNPSLVAKEGGTFHELIKEICGIVSGPVSAEVLSLEPEGMLREARELAKIADNVVVKIPMGLPGMRAVRQLSQEGIATNVTLVFSSTQALWAAKSGATFVSPFVGRIDDRAGDGMDVVDEILEIYGNYGCETEVIVASVRHVRHVVESALLGADIATVPYKVARQLFEHPLTAEGIDHFLEDWKGLQA